MTDLKLTEKGDGVLSGVEISKAGNEANPIVHSSNPDRKSDKELNREVKRAEKVAKREAKRQNKLSKSGGSTAKVKPDKEAKRAEKIARREAKKREKEVKGTSSMAQTTTTKVEEGKIQRKSVFEEAESLLTKVFDAILAIIGLMELGVTTVKELPSILKWLIKFIFFSGVVGKKESEQ